MPEKISPNMGNKVVMLYMSANPWVTEEIIEEIVKEVYLKHKDEFPVGKLYILKNIKNPTKMIHWLSKIFGISKRFQAGWG